MAINISDHSLEDAQQVVAPGAFTIEPLPPSRVFPLKTNRRPVQWPGMRYMLPFPISVNAANLRSIESVYKVVPMAKACAGLGRPVFTQE
jgi:hypothetical protein